MIDSKAIPLRKRIIESFNSLKDEGVKRWEERV